MNRSRKFGIRSSEFGTTANAGAALRTPHSPLPTGFTLIEMLVAVGLVVLMMSLFATIFQMSTGAMATQKGIAENDQRSRLALTLLRGDLQNRTAQIVQPFELNEDTTQAESNVADRRGYFYIGENDRDDDTDDVLAFTVTVGSGGDPFYGHALSLSGNNPNIATDPNQPEFDDGISDVNSAGSSQYAEVCYFLRNGTLYRRVLLVRQPIKSNDVTSGTPKSGSAGDGTAILMPQYRAGGTSNFLTDMHYSAYYTAAGPAFHGVAELANDRGPSDPFRLGKPNFRFGHNHATGLPREFVLTNFIGRFTHWETSYQALAPYTPLAGNTTQYFGYPGRMHDPPGNPDPVAPNPMDPATSLTYDSNLGLVTTYSLFDSNGRAVPGRRASEDILLTRVQRFDIKVWDEAASVGPDGQPGRASIDAGPDLVYGTGDDLPVDDNGVAGPNDNGELGWPGTDDGAFRDVGHRGPTGFYREGAQEAATAAQYFGTHPADATRTLWRFDTWNPNVNLDGAGGDDPPPFHAPDDPTNANPAVRRPLKAIQIRIAFFDPLSQQLREATFVQSLTKSN